MQHDLVILLKAVKYAAIALAGLTVVGIVTLMYIARDKDEDITGIVAPALLIVIVSTVAAIVAGVLQKRSTGRDGVAVRNEELSGKEN